MRLLQYVSHRCAAIAITLSLSMSAAFAISVDLWVAEGAYCSLPTGSLYAGVQGGVAPYTYNWYRQDFGNWVPVCMGCTNSLNSLWEFTTYKVVVTDALSATAEATQTVPGLVATWINNVMHWPFLEGTAPVIGFTLYGESVGGTVAHQADVIPNTGIGGYTGGSGLTYTAALPIGATTCTIYAWRTDASEASACPAFQAQPTIAGATALPTLTALQVQPSCSNGSTGRIDYAMTNGVIPQGIYVHLKNMSGTVLGTNGQLTGQMPTMTGVFTGVAPGTYRMVLSGLPSNVPVNLGIPGFVYTCRDSITVVVPSTGVSCGQVQGSVFIDTNLNCTMQGGEPGVPGVVLKVLPGPFFVNTNSTGSYSLQLPAGNYTINEEHAQVGQNCSALPIPFTVPAVVTPVMVNVPCTSLVAMDASISIASGPARPGFPMQYAVQARNLTPATSGSVTITVQLDPSLSFTSANPAPTSVAGSTLTWSQAALTPFESRSINITAQVPNDVSLLGTSLATTAAIATVVADGAMANNQAICATAVTGSFDPNDKLALTSSGSRTHYDPTQDSWIDYVIRFQNTGTDTAFTVVITDTLPTNLDPATFVIGAASHAFTWTLNGSRNLRFQFVNIRLPHSAINEPGSHGFVSFRIRPVLPLAAGTQISNRANIFFDFNAPVITDPSLLTVPSPPVLVSPRVYLSGAYSASTPPLNDALRVLGRLPLMEPYTAMGFEHAGTGGGEIVQPSVLQVTGNNGIVDWVLVELRQAGGAGAVVASRAALLQRDGDVVATNGTAPVAFHVVPGSYRVAIRHRNHLGAMTSAALSLTTSATTVNFTSTGTSTYGVNAQINTNGVMALWPGDTGFDGTAKYVGTNNDRDPILVAIGGSTPTNVVNNVYSRLDVNLDGVIKYVGANNDRDPILTTVGGSTPTNTRTQQLP
jgi:uncharacterized repeat protein (TIGR01451 family)